GRWLREGEPVPNPGALLPQPEAKAQALPRPEQVSGYGVQLRVRGLGENASGLPTSALAEEILMEGEGQVRALISMGGNPMAAWPDQLRTFEAMKKLDLSLTLDIKMSATAKLCDYVIAPKLSLEVPSTTQPNENVQFYGVSTGYPAPYAQYSPKVIDPPPKSDVIEEWEFFYGLAQRMGLQLRVHGQNIDMENKPDSDDLLYIIASNGRVSLDDVKAHPNGHIFKDESIKVRPKDDAWSHRLDIGHPDMMQELEQVAEEGMTTHAGYRPEDEFSHRLISRRMDDVYNSSGRDIPNLTKNYNYNPAFMNPADLAALELASGDVVKISSARASILGIVEEAEDIKRGAISMAHAWGDAPENDNQVHFIGSNTGRLTDSTEYFDHRTGLPMMSAIPVNVEKTADPSEI
ncbi:MAG: molybdopterin-dependent oxidoreductase, partial [Gammaproteobacteria bacterium]|nr:molybdopterin-dependent oxidoreductase [Gammaproteobacteria bacterium]